MAFPGHHACRRPSRGSLGRPPRRFQPATLAHLLARRVSSPAAPNPASRGRAPSRAAGVLTRRAKPSQPRSRTFSRGGCPHPPRQTHAHPSPASRKEATGRCRRCTARPYHRRYLGGKSNGGSCSVVGGFPCFLSFGFLPLAPVNCSHRDGAKSIPRKKIVSPPPPPALSIGRAGALHPRGALKPRMKSRLGAKQPTCNCQEHGHPLG